MLLPIPRPGCYKGWKLHETGLQFAPCTNSTYLYLLSDWMNVSVRSSELHHMAYL